MSRRFSFRAALLPGAALALLLAPAAAPAQSLLASRGLGYPIDPLDARARGLGGITTGLAEPMLSLVNPASPAGLPAPALVVSLQPERYDATAGDVHTTGSTVRFPLIQAAFPFGSRLVASAGYGAFLDQNWQVEQSDSITLSTGRVAVNDRFVSAGAVARFRGGLAYQVSERLGVGVGLDVLTGAAHDSARRVITGLVPSQSGVTFTYRGLGGSVGARWAPTGRMAFSAAVRAGGNIRAESSDSATNEVKEYSSPVVVDAGASARVARATMAAVSAHWAGWSTANDALSANGGARDEMGATAGLEYSGLRLLGKETPVRLGGRFTQLPFRWGDASNAFPTEKAISAGLGVRLAGRAAQIDGAAERGWRGGGDSGIDEPYWRLSFSLSVLGR